MIRFCFALAVVFSFFIAPARAQTKSSTSGQAAKDATIQGVVMDPRGAVVPRASVTLTTSTEAVETTQTDNNGKFSFTDIVAGIYRIVATAPGLSASSGDIQMRAGATQHADLSLVLSAVDQHVVVSAHLGDVLDTQTASSVSVITEDEIASHDAQTVYDVLRDVPGVAVADSGRRGGDTSVFIRGGNYNYNLVMVDGIPLNQFGGDFDFSFLPTDGVAQMEVTRGAESALYGSEAVSGVVNLVTHRGDGPPSFSALMEGGSYDTYRLATGGDGSFRGFHWSYDLSRLDSNGVVANDDYHNQSAFVSLGYSKNPRRQLDLHFFGDANDAGVPGPYGSDPDQLFTGIDTVSRDKQNLFGYQASEAEQIASRWKQVSTVSVTTDRYLFISPFGDSFTKNLRIVANSRAEIRLTRTDIFVAGFEYNQERYEDTYVADANNNPFVLPRTSLAYFAENRWNPGNRWSVTTGVRVDDIRTHALPPDAFGERPLLPASSIVQANPRAAVAYLLRSGGPQATWGATRLHTSAGTGIRPPDGFELGFTDNPHLKPERSITTDVGIEQRLFRDRAVVDVAYFYNRFKDQIVSLGGSVQNLSTFTSDNLNNSRAQGVEISARVQPTRNLEISAQYTRLDSAILALDGTTLAQTPFQVGQPLIRRPANSGSYDVTWQRGRLRLNTNAYARGWVLDDEPNLGISACSLGLPCLFRNHGYVLANGGFSVRTIHNVEIFGQINNLLNQKYEEVLGYPAYHLNFMTGIRFRFPSERGAAGRP
jgi:outer membrane receptor protein involved in Fe transport